MAWFTTLDPSAASYETIAMIARVLFAALALSVPSQCGRKGELVAPGAEAPSNTASNIAISRGLEPTARMGDTVVTRPGSAPDLRRTRDSDAAQLRAADIRGANADAPEVGDAIPEGPTVGSTTPNRRFVLDPLL